MQPLAWAFGVAFVFVFLATGGFNVSTTPQWAKPLDDAKPDLTAPSRTYHDSRVINVCKGMDSPDLDACAERIERDAREAGQSIATAVSNLEELQKGLGKSQELTFRLQRQRQVMQAIEGNRAYGYRTQVQSQDAAILPPEVRAHCQLFSDGSLIC
jgi:hypothetical protein